MVGLMILKIFFTNPFSLYLQGVTCYPPEIQIKIIDLQHHTPLKSKYKKLISTGSDPNYIEFWNFAPTSSFPNLHDLAVGYCCKFG